MVALLIADKSAEFRKNMANWFIDAEYNVILTNSATSALCWTLKKEAEVVIISSELLDSEAFNLIHTLKMCNARVTIILVSDDIPLPVLRKYREEGIFYHSLRPDALEDKHELLEAVRCAFQSTSGEPIPPLPAGAGAWAGREPPMPERRQP